MICSISECEWTCSIVCIIYTAFYELLHKKWAYYIYMSFICQIVMHFISSQIFRFLKSTIRMCLNDLSLFFFWAKSLNVCCLWYNISSTVGTKKKKRIESSDDDFEEDVFITKSKKHDVKGKGKSSVLIDEDDEEVICRCIPNPLMKALDGLNKRQRKTV